MRKLLGLLLSLALVFSLAACKSDESTDTPTGNETGEPVEQEPKVLRIATDVEVPSIDAQIATDGLSFEIVGATIEGLLQYDANGKLVPSIAKSYEVSEDGLIYTFYLREDAKWDNGTTVTAHDFEFAWKRGMNPDVGSEYSWIFFVAGVKNARAIYDGEADYQTLGIEAVSDYELVVTLDNEAPFFVQLMTFNTFFPINEEFYNAQDGQYGMRPENVLANGPFKITKWQEGYGLTVEKNETYYDADSVQIDSVEWRVFKDAQTAALEFEAGSVDVVKLNSELVDRYKDDEAFTNDPGGYVWYVAPNYASGMPELENLNFRMALGMGFDKSYIANSVLNDGSVAANYIVPTGLAASPVDGTDYREAQTRDFLNYDVTEAQKHWELAKQELGKSEIEIELLFDDAESVKRMAEFMKSEWETNLEGLTVILKTQPKKNRLQLMREDKFQLGITRWGPDYADPQTYLELFKPGGSSSTDYANPVYLEMLEKISGGGELASSTKTVERWDMMLEMEQVLLDDAGVFPIYQSGYAMLISPEVSGIEVHSVGLPHVYKNVKIG
ncbi:peptide ABC transporter substrate-binding protein [Mycoplasmatota bacterium]|nr:peptide ABC transporter substrate-binding protein [Mycoplasmatota bacterium]